MQRPLARLHLPFPPFRILFFSPNSPGSIPEWPYRRVHVSDGVLGWHTVAQDRATSVVYGMPKAAAELNAAAEVLPLAQIGPAVRGRLTALAGTAGGR